MPWSSLARLRAGALCFDVNAQPHGSIVLEPKNKGKSHPSAEAAPSKAGRRLSRRHARFLERVAAPAA